MASGTIGQADAPIVTAAEAMQRLVDGNERFASGRMERPHQDADRRRMIAEGQQPFAAILSCADSRVPPEMAFDEGLGDLFVIRTAGQVVDRAVLGSIQYGVLELHVPLLLVLGHSQCGAVKAALAASDGADPTATDIDMIISEISPATVNAGSAADPIAAAVRANVEREIDALRSSIVIADALEAGRIDVRGGIYDLATGRVEMF